MPFSARYLYPDTDDYFYRYGDGYMYRVDRGDQLISALLPLASAAVIARAAISRRRTEQLRPELLRVQQFYPDYGSTIVTATSTAWSIRWTAPAATIDNVIPLYDSGYGVGQMLPASYGYYNVPYQYRDMYYDTLGL